MNGEGECREGYPSSESVDAVRGCPGAWSASSTLIVYNSTSRVIKGCTVITPIANVILLLWRLVFRDQEEE